MPYVLETIFFLWEAEFGKSLIVKQILLQYFV